MDLRYSYSAAEVQAEEVPREPGEEFPHLFPRRAARVLAAQRSYRPRQGTVRAERVRFPHSPLVPLGLAFSGPTEPFPDPRGQAFVGALRGSFVFEPFGRREP